MYKKNKNSLGDLKSFILKMEYILQISFEEQQQQLNQQQQYLLEFQQLEQELQLYLQEQLLLQV